MPPQNDPMSMTSSFLSDDEEVLFAFQDIVKIPKTIKSKLGDIFFKNFKDFSKIRQDTLNEMTLLEQTLIRFKEALDGDDRFQDFPKAAQTAYDGFKRIFNRQYEYGYERAIALGTRKSSVGDGISKLEELKSQIIHSRNKAEKYIQNGMQIKTFSFDDFGFEASIETDFIGTAKNLLVGGVNLEDLDEDNYEGVENIMICQAKQIFEAQDWNSTSENMLSSFNFERDLYIAPKDIAWFQNNKDTMQQYFIELNVILGLIHLCLTKTQADAEEYENIYRSRILHVNTSKLELKELTDTGVPTSSGGEQSGRTTEEQERFNYLSSRIPALESRLEQMDLTLERVQLTTIHQTYETLYAEYITLRGEGWDDPTKLLQKFNLFANSALGKMYAQTKQILFDVLYISRSFVSKGKNKKELEISQDALKESSEKCVAAKEAVNTKINSSTTKLLLSNYLSDIEEEMVFTQSIGNNLDATQLKATFDQTIENIETVLEDDNIEALKTNLAQADGHIRNIGTIIEIIETRYEEVDTELKPFFQSFIEEGKNFLALAENEKVKLLTETTNPEIIITAMDGFETSAHQSQISLFQLIKLYNSNAAKAFFIDVKIVQDLIKLIKENIETLNNNLYDPATTMSLQAHLKEQIHRFDMAMLTSRKDISSAHNTLSKKWFSRSIKGKLDKLKTDIKPKLKHSESIKATTFKDLPMFIDEPILIEFPREEVANMTFEYTLTYFSHQNAMTALEQMKGENSWYRPSKNKVDIAQLESMMEQNPNIMPRFVKSEINSRIIQPSVDQIKKLHASGVTGEVLANTETDMIEKSKKDIEEYIKNQTIKARTLIATTDKNNKKNALEGVRLFITLGLSVARVLASLGADIPAVISVITTTVQVILFIIKLMRGISTWAKMMAKELLKLHQKVTKDYHDGLCKWFVNVAATVTPSQVEGFPLSTVLSGLKFFANINGSIEKTRDALQNTMAQLNTLQSQHSSLSKTIDDLLKITNKCTNDINKDKKMPTKSKNKILIQLSKTEEKIFETIPKTEEMGSMITLVRGMTDKANADLVLYNDFLNTRIPSGWFQDPNGVKNLFSTARLGQSSYDASNILISGDYMDWEKICDGFTSSANMLSGLSA